MLILANKEEMRARLEVCAACDQLKRGVINRCGACGCPIRSKVLVKATECPLKKWPAIK